MTEQEWLDATVPAKMITQLKRRGKLTDRKARLFAIACCRATWKALGSKQLEAVVEVSEQYADKLITATELRVARRSIRSIIDQVYHNDVRGELWTLPVIRAKFAPFLAEELASTSMDAVIRSTRFCLIAARGAHDYIRRHNHEILSRCERLRDLFGPTLFRKIHIPPSQLKCHESTAVKLAQAAYDDRELPSGHLDIKRLAILADALEEAGCTNEDVLAHLRGPGPHVRGCWVVDLLLGKK